MSVNEIELDPTEDWRPGLVTIILSIYKQVKNCKSGKGRQ